MNGLRLAARQLLRYPGFSAIVIATLALGLGASTLIFRVVNGVLLKPLPYPDPDRIVRVLQVNENGFVGNNISEPNFSDLKEQTRSFSAPGVIRPGADARNPSPAAASRRESRRRSSRANSSTSFRSNRSSVGRSCRTSCRLAQPRRPSSVTRTGSVTSAAIPRSARKR